MLHLLIHPDLKEVEPMLRKIYEKTELDLYIFADLLPSFPNRVLEADPNYSLFQLMRSSPATVLKNKPPGSLYVEIGFDRYELEKRKVKKRYLQKQVDEQRLRLLGRLLEQQETIEQKFFFVRPFDTYIRRQFLPGSPREFSDKRELLDEAFEKYFSPAIRDPNLAIPLRYLLEGIDHAEIAAIEDLPDAKKFLNILLAFKAQTDRRKYKEITPHLLLSYRENRLADFISRLFTIIIEMKHAWTHQRILLS